MASLTVKNAKTKIVVVAFLSKVQKIDSPSSGVHLWGGVGVVRLHPSYLSNAVCIGISQEFSSH
eukprot:1357415-Amphidinium_carterae.1